MIPSVYGSAVASGVVGSSLDTDISVSRHPERSDGSHGLEIGSVEGGRVVAGIVRVVAGVLPVSV